jgi:hypothetical protein
MGQIRRDNALAADYLSLAACVDRKDVPLDLLEASSYGEREDAVKVLSRYRLVTRRPADTALDLHRLVHHALREWLRKQNQLGKWTQHAIAQLLQVFPNSNHSSRSRWRRLLPHAKHALSHIVVSPEDSDRLGLVQKCAITLYSDGRWKEAEELGVQLMETRKRVLGEEHPDTLTSRHNLAFTLHSQARREKALALMETCLQSR